MAPQPGIAELVLDAPIRAQARRTTVWCVTAVVFAMGADALGLAWRPFGTHVAWLEWAALGCLVAALTLPGTWRARARWGTALDSRVLCALLLAATQLLPAPPGSAHAFTLRQALACAALYFGLVAQVRAAAVGVERLWEGIGLVAVLAGAHVTIAATSGLGALREALAGADAAWGASAGLFKSLALVAVLCAGRAFEPGAGRGWRLLTVFATLAAALAALAGGTGLKAEALGRLDDPLHFSGIVVLLLLLAELVRRAWTLRREHPEQASRWRAAGLAGVTLALFAVFGAASGGEGLRALGTLLGVLVVMAAEPAAEAAPPGGESLRVTEEPPGLARAA